MKTVGFPISHKENEYRRAIVPEHLKKIEHPELFYFEKGYGVVLGIDDSEYEACGSHVVSHEDVLAKDIICDPKIGDADYLTELKRADVRQYDRRTEELLRDELGQYDVIVNCVLWDVMRKDHIIYRDDLKRMKRNSMIVDVSCDRNGGIETSIPTTIEDPTCMIDGVMHYVVDHTPALFHKTFTWNNSEVIWRYINELQSKNYDEVLSDALIVKDGEIVDDEIRKFQGR